MSRAPITPKGRILDICDCPPVFADELVLIQELGPVTHLRFAMREQTPDGDMPPHRRVVVHMIVPKEARIAMGRQLLARECGVDAGDGAEMTAH